MKRLSTLLVALVVAFTASSQAQTIYLFDQFPTATITFLNGSTAQVQANYDACNHKLLYKENDELMELTDAKNIGKIVFGDRTFIPMNKDFVEMVHLEHGDVYVQWNFKDIYMGTTGALGSVNQARAKPQFVYGVGSKAVEHPDEYIRQKINENEVFKRKSENVYFIRNNGKMSKIKNLNQLIKIYPNKEEAIRQYIKDEKIEMQYAEDVLTLLNFCMQ